MIANAFKVVFPDNHNIKKSILWGPYVLEYSLNTKTVPMIGKIFVFATLQDAINFATLFSVHEIYECYAENMLEHSNKYIAGFPDEIKDFWHNNLTPSFKSPEGTYLADSVTLLSKVDL